VAGTAAVIDPEPTGVTVESTGVRRIKVSCPLVPAIEADVDTAVKAGDGVAVVHVTPSGLVSTR
jgi:hypothetical protein